MVKPYQAEGRAVVTAMGSHICYGESEEHAKRIADGMNDASDVRGTLLAALQRIAGGEVMAGTFTHAETVHEYQRIARAAIAKVQS